MKRNQKLFRVVAVLALFCLTTGFAFAGGARQNSGKKVIGVCMQGNQTGFISYQVAAMYEYLKNNQINDIELRFVYADDDAEKQQSQVEQFVSQGVDCIILGPVDYVQSATAIDYSIDNGVPIITLANRSSSKRATGHAGSNDIQAGTMQMERIIKMGAKNVAYITAVLGHSVQINREQGYKNVLAKNPNVKLVVQNTANWSTDEALRLVENWLQTYPGQIEGIVANSDSLIKGAITACENAGLGGKILLSGVAGDIPVMEKIKAGMCDSTLWKDGIGEGEWALRLAIDVVNGKPIKDVDVPFVEVTKENVDEMMKRSRERDALAAKYL
jgi:ABC-type sugar transport system substrate-binding protein